MHEHNVELNRLLIRQPPGRVKTWFDLGHTDIVISFSENSHEANRVIWSAVLLGDIQAVTTCLQQGTLAHTVYLNKDNFSQSLLSKAIELGYIEIAKLLIEKGANPNYGVVCPSEVYPPLYQVINSQLENSLEMARLLLDKSANPNCYYQSQTAKTSLLYAAISNFKTGVADLLRQVGACVLASRNERVLESGQSWPVRLAQPSLLLLDRPPTINEGSAACLDADRVVPDTDNQLVFLGR